MFRGLPGRVAGSIVIAVLAVSGCTAHPSTASASPSTGRQPASGFKGSLSGTATINGHTNPFRVDYALSVGSPQKAAKPDEFGRDVLTLPVTVDAKLTNTTAGGDPRGTGTEFYGGELGGFYQ